MRFHQKRYLVCQESFICHDKRTHSPEMPPLGMILCFSFKLKFWAKRWILPNKLRTSRFPWDAHAPLVSAQIARRGFGCTVKSSSIFVVFSHLCFCKFVHFLVLFLLPGGRAPPNLFSFYGLVVTCRTARPNRQLQDVSWVVLRLRVTRVLYLFRA